jgi:hypothetical protein
MAGESARAEAQRARERAERLARRAEAFEKGADGEQRTAEVLAALPPGWSAIHDVRWPSRRLANIDHVVVGPGGIFVVDSKNWSGKVTVDKGVLRQNGRARETAVAGCADAGLAIAELAGLHADKVFPVLCFVTDKRLAGWSRDVMICSTATLNEMLLSRGRVLRDEQVTEAWLRLDAELRAATEAAPATSGRGWDRAPAAARLGRSPARATRMPSRSSRRKSSAAGELRRLVAFLVMVGAFIAFGPQVLSATGELVAERLTENLTSSIDCDMPGESRRAEGQAPRDKTPSSTGDC